DTELLVYYDPNTQHPTAHAGADFTVNDNNGDGYELVTVAGSGTDSDGSVQQYFWYDGNEFIGGGNNPSIQMNLAVGVHEITLITVDNQGGTGEDRVRVTVSSGGPSNQVPVAAAGNDVVVTDSDNNSNETISLNGSGSYDNDGSIVSYIWSENGSQIASGANANVNFAIGTHNVILSVTDNNGAVSTDSVVVTVNPGSSPNQAPTAAAGADQSLTDSDDNSSEAVSLSASASSDSDGTIVSYLWTENGSQIASGISAQLNLSVGVHTITLTVTDDDGASDSDSLVVTVDAAPVVGTETFVVYSEGKQSSAAWQHISISGAAGYYANLAFLNSDPAEGNEHVLVSGTNTWGGSVRWNLNTAHDLSALNTANTWMHVTIRDNTNTGLPIDFQVGIVNSDGSKERFGFTKYVQQNPGYESLQSYVEVLPNNYYRFHLNMQEQMQQEAAANSFYTVPDLVETVSMISIVNKDGTSGWNFDADDVYFTIVGSAPANNPPVADAGSDQSLIDNASNGSILTFLNASGSADSDGSITSFVWTENGSQIATGPSPSVNMTVGVHTLTLTVTDDDAASASDTVVITILPAPNQNPVAAAGPDQIVTDADDNGSEAVSLDASGSIDNDGNITAYLWTENGSQIASGVNPSVNLSVGVHTVVLTITDDNGASHTDAVIITVNAPANQAPVAAAGADQTVADNDDNGSESINLNASGSSDVDGTIASYVWTENASQIATGVSPTINFAVGTHNLSLTVTDDNGATSTDAVTIIINAAPVAGLRTPENPAGTVNGLDYNYYESAGQWSVLPDFTALSAVANGTTADFDLSLRLRDDDIGFVFSGYIDVPADGTYTFYTTSDDGSKLFIGSTEVVDNDGLHGMVEQSGSIGLQAGKHAISVEFFERGYDEGLIVSWESPALTKATVPVSALHRLGSAPANQNPIAAAGVDQTHTDANDNGSESVTLNASGSSDSDGTIVSYVWTENGSQIATGVSPTINAAVGVHTIILTVTDDDAANHTDAVVIIVNAPANQAPLAAAGSDQTIVDSDDN
ncbi:MAG: hypothetical protein HRU15_16730, partial [Planctomycetes bacterium]|nr:hypothetical protein [Planctomycetota bacterium]